MDISVTLNRLSPIPLYHQLAAQLKDAISAGTLPKGTFLGNELVLADQWQVSRPTVRRAIQGLVDDGLLVRRRGIGTQVVNDVVRRPFTLTSLHDDLTAGGRRPSTAVVSIERVRAPSDIAEALGVRTGTNVVHTVRLRLADSQPLAVLSNWLPIEFGGDLDVGLLEDRGLYTILRERGVRPHYAVQRLGARGAGEIESSLLGVAMGAPLVTMWRAMQDDTGRPIEVGDHAYDAAHYSVEMSVVEN
ncbi:MAG: GntR family transcriptional regulator [Ilumatobacteraceae bacterium]